MSSVAAGSGGDPTPSSGTTCCCRCRCSSSSPGTTTSGADVDAASRRPERTASERGPSSKADRSDPNPPAAAAAAASKSVASTPAAFVPPTPNQTFFASTAGFWDPMPFGHPPSGDPPSSAPTWPSASSCLKATASEPAVAAKSFSAEPGLASRQGKDDHRPEDKVDALLAGVMSALELDSSRGDGDKDDGGDDDGGRGGPTFSATMLPWDGPAHLPPTGRGSPSVSRVLGPIPEASDNSARSVSDRNSMGTSPSPSFALPVPLAGSSLVDGGWQPLSALPSTPEDGLLQAIAGNQPSRHASTSFDWGLETSSVGSSTPVSSNVLKTPIGGFPSSVW
ncbi:unnamed protein product [Scytosiphon promiscuus]